MDLGTIGGVGGVVVLVGILVEVARRTGWLADKWTPVASIVVGAAIGPMYFFIGWLAVPPTPTPEGRWLAAALIGLLAGASTDGLTSAGKTLAGKPSTP